MPWPYDTPVRAVVLDTDGRPQLADVPEPKEPFDVLACGLCGSDVEKLGRAPAGTVLGHEVVARLSGRRVALRSHREAGGLRGDAEPLVPRRQDEPLILEHKRGG